MVRLPEFSSMSDVAWPAAVGSGFALGIVAFCVGVGIVHATFVLDYATTAPALVDSAFTYVLFHGVVRATEGGGTLVGESVWLAVLFGTVPALPVTLAGYGVARRYTRGVSRASAGPLVGATVAVGYVPAMVVAALLVETEGSLGSRPGLLAFGISPDPVTALLGGALFGLLLGAVGGAGTRSRRAGTAVGALCLLFAIPSVFLTLALL